MEERPLTGLGSVVWDKDKGEPSHDVVVRGRVDGEPSRDTGGVVRGRFDGELSRDTAGVFRGLVLRLGGGGAASFLGYISFMLREGV